MIIPAPTKIAVAGATGHIGSLTVNTLRTAGHAVVEVSRTHGVDLYSGNAVIEALNGVDVVIDTLNTTSGSPSGG